MTTRNIILFLVVLFAIWAVLSYLILFVFVFGSVFMFEDQFLVEGKKETWLRLCERMHLILTDIKGEIK